KGQVGWHADERKNLDELGVFKELAPEDLVRFGMIPEFIGRLPVVSVLEELDVHQLEHILTETKNALVKQYGALLAMENVRLTFRKDALRASAETAMHLKTGARALRAILESMMLDIMYDIPGTPDLEGVSITGGVVNGKSKPKFRSKADAA